MIIAVSIVDKHKPGVRHIGTYLFEIDYPGGSHFDLMAVVCPVENEHLLRDNNQIGRLLKREDIHNPVRGDGTPATESESDFLDRFSDDLVN